MKTGKEYCTKFSLCSWTIGAVTLMLILCLLMYRNVLAFNDLEVKDIGEEESNYLRISNAIFNGHIVSTEPKKTKKKTETRYILLWTRNKDGLLKKLGKGHEVFENKRCSYKNCFVTDNETYLKDVTEFDAVVFGAPDVMEMIEKFPTKRSPHQKYIFASEDSAYSTPVCSKELDKVFNWTWTYKLDSTMRWGLVVRDLKNRVMGPQYNMTWIEWEQMNPVKDDIKDKVLIHKHKAAAWFVSNCNTNSYREKFALALRNALKSHDLELDIYGKCSNITCGDSISCHKMLENDYYFYLSFEEAFSEDYATPSTLFHGLKHLTVPIVYGGADYTRFLPTGSYLNTRHYTIPKLAAKMKALIDDKEEYLKYFKWMEHYKFSITTDSRDTDEICSLCTLLHSKAFKTPSVIQNFSKWWDPDNVPCVKFS